MTIAIESRESVADCGGKVLAIVGDSTSAVRASFAEGGSGGEDAEDGVQEVVEGEAGEERPEGGETGADDS